MRELTLALLCALLLPACLTQGLWAWAGDTHPVNPHPVSCGVDADGTTIILVAVADEAQPSFCLRVPVNWRDRRVQIPIGATGDSIHAPMFLRPEPLPSNALAALTPAPEEWFLSHEPETGYIDILVSEDGGYTTVGTAELPTKVDWGRRIIALALTAPTLVIDVAAFLSSKILHSLQFDMFELWGHENGESSHSTEPAAEPDTELIHPSHGPS